MLNAYSGRLIKLVVVAFGVEKRNGNHIVFTIVVHPESSTRGHCDHITLFEVPDLLVTVTQPPASSLLLLYLLKCLSTTRQYYAKYSITCTHTHKPYTFQ